MHETIRNEIIFEWANLLKASAADIQLDADLATLGIDSLLLLTFFSKMEAKGFLVDPSEFIECGSIADQILCYARFADQPDGKANQVECSYGSHGLLSSQCWFVSEEFPEKNKFSIPIVYETDKTLDPVSLKLAIAETVRSHPSLYSKHNHSSKKMEIIDEGCLDLFLSSVFNVIDLSGFDAAERLKEYTKCTNELNNLIDLDKGWCIASAYIVFPSGIKNRLVIFVHHMAADLYSVIVIRREIWLRYKGFLEKKTIAVPVEKASMKMISEELESLRATDKYAQDLSFWKRSLTNEVLPRFEELGEFNKDNNKTWLTAIEKFVLEKSESELIVHSVKNVFNISIRDLILVCLYRVIASWGNKSALTILPVDSARSYLYEKLGVNVSNTVGWVSWSPPVIFNGNPGCSFDSKEFLDNLQQIRACDEKGYAYEIGYLIDGANSLKPIDNQYKIVFNYFGNTEISLEEESSAGAIKIPACENTALTYGLENDRAFVFYIEAQLRSDGLEVLWNYSKSLHSSTTVQFLSKSLEQELKLMAGYLKENTR